MEREKVDFGQDKFSLGGLFFKGIEKLIDLSVDLKEAGGEIKKEGEVDLSHLKNGLKGMFGISINTAIGGRPTAEPFRIGKPAVEQFRRIKKAPQRIPQRSRIEEKREPLIDVFDEKEEIQVYADMPAVNKEDIKLDLKGESLSISAKNKYRNYHKEILLPAKIKPETLISSYRNGILEVKMRK